MRFLVPALAMLLAVLPATDGGAVQCSVTTSPINFGTYDVFSTVPADSTADITVSCSGSTPVTVAINAGRSGSVAQRYMLNGGGGADRLNYNLFTTPSMTTAWGDGTGGSKTVHLAIPSKMNSATTTIYGRIPPGQDLRVGNYSDTLTITINW